MISAETLVILLGFFATAIGIIKIQLDTRAAINKINAESAAHVLKKQADISELSEKRASQKIDADAKESEAVNITVTTLARNSDRLFQEFASAKEIEAKTREALVDLTKRQVTTQEEQTKTLTALLESYTNLAQIVPTVLGLNAVMTEFETVRQAVGQFETADSSLVAVIQKIEADIESLKQFNEARRKIDLDTAALLKAVNTSLQAIKERINQIPGMPKAAPEVVESSTLQKVKLEGTIGELPQEDKDAA